MPGPSGIPGDPSAAPSNVHDIPDPKKGYGMSLHVYVRFESYECLELTGHRVGGKWDSGLVCVNLECSDNGHYKLVLVLKRSVASGALLKKGGAFIRA